MSTSDWLWRPTHTSTPGMSYLASVSQITNKWDISGTFSDQISAHFGSSEPKCAEIWSEKDPDMSHLWLIWPTLGTNLPTLCSSISLRCWTGHRYAWGKPERRYFTSIRRFRLRYLQSGWETLKRLKVQINRNQTSHQITDVRFVYKKGQISTNCDKSENFQN